VSNIKFSVCIEMIFSDLPMLERISAVAEAGYPAVEFWGWHGKDMQAIAERIEQEGLNLAGFCAESSGDLCNPEVTRDWVQEAADSIDQADNFGVPVLIVTTGNELADVPRQQQHQAIVEGLTAIAPYAEEKDITLCLEPLNVLVDHAGYYLVTSDEGFEIVDEVNSPSVKLLYDIYHQQITEGNLIATITANMGKIGHFHVADVPGRYEPGTGEINYANVFARIAESDYDGYVGLEFRASTTNEDAVARVLDVANRS